MLRPISSSVSRLGWAIRTRDGWALEPRGYRLSIAPDASCSDAAVIDLWM